MQLLIQGRTCFISLSSFLILMFVFCQSTYGYFSEEGNAVTKALGEELIRQGICTEDHLSCSKMLQMYGRDGKHIQLNMYAQKDKHLALVVSQFLIENGLELSNQIPIILTIYTEPKTEHLGLRSVFWPKPPAMKLELNQ